MTEMILNCLVLLKSVSLLFFWTFISMASGATLLKLIFNCANEWLEKYRGEYFLVSLLIGLLLTISLSICLMVSIGLSAGTAYTMIIFFLLTGFPSAKEVIKFIDSAISRYFNDFKQHQFLSVVGLLVLCSLVVFFSLLSLLPPVSTDELIYHVWQPNHGRYLLENPELGNIHLWMPRNMETMFFFFRVMSGDFLASTMFQAVLFFLVVSIIAKYFSNYVHSITIAFMISTMCVLSIHAFPRYVTSFLVDSGTHALIILFGVMLLSWIKDNNNIPAILAAGLSGGLALGSKYFALYYIVPFSIITIPFLLKIFFIEPIKTLKLVGIVCVLAFLGCGFWYLRNIFFTKNPFYPFMFAHPGFSNEEILQLKQVVGRIGTPMNWSYLFAPFLSEYKPYRSFFFIPGFISLGAFLFSKYRKEASVLSAGLILVITLIQSFQVGIYPRYHISLFVLASTLAAFTITGMIQRSKFWKTIGIAILFFMVLFNSCISLYAMRPLVAVNYFLGKLPIERVYRRSSSLVAFEINSMKNGTNYRILTITPEEFFSFYRPPDKDIAMKLADITRNIRFDDLDDQEILTFFGEMGITHFLTKDDEGFARQVASRSTLYEFLRIYKVRKTIVVNSRHIPLKSSTAYKLYELESKREEL